MSKIAAIYVRVSSIQQEKDGASLETQEAACRKYAADQGWTIDERFVYRETHKRWLLHERPEITRLRADARAREFQVVLCYCVDRLSSKDAHVYILEEEFEKVGVLLDFATDSDWSLRPKRQGPCISYRG
jgi:site-specific DNA recombinase